VTTGRDDARWTFFRRRRLRETWRPSGCLRAAALHAACWLTSPFSLFSTGLRAVCAGLPVMRRQWIRGRVQGETRLPRVFARRPPARRLLAESRWSTQAPVAVSSTLFCVLLERPIAAPAGKPRVAFAVLLPAALCACLGQVGPQRYVLSLFAFGLSAPFLRSEYAAPSVTRRLRYCVCGSLHRHGRCDGGT